ncbi:MAG TPA: CHAT domain-containing protein, partial [Kofleriaceae bacterium]
MPPLKVHLCWFANDSTDPLCAAVAHHLHEILHRPLADAPVQRPGIEIPVEHGRSLAGLLDALEQGREPAAGVRLVVAILDGAAFASDADRRVLRRARSRWGQARPGEVFLPIVVGGGWIAELGADPGFEVLTVDDPAEVDDPVRRWRLGIQVCIAAGRALLARRASAEPPQPRVLLSYARSDGAALTRTLAACFATDLQLAVWHDRSPAPTGAELARQLQRANGDAVVLIVRTDRYSESPECTLELLAAKQSRAPIVTLMATEDGEITAPAYSGNHRTMNWKDGRELEVAGRCVQAWLHGHHFRAGAVAALALAGLPADSDILPRHPELLDLVGIGRTGRRLVVHPDPPLTDGDAAVLRTAAPAVRIATPTTLFGRVLLARDPEPPLTGTTLAFSLSVAEDLPWLNEGKVDGGLTQEHLEDVIYSIVLATLRSGARIAYGGDLRPEKTAAATARGYARHLIELHRAYGGLGTRGSAQLLCYLGRGADEDVGRERIEFAPTTVKPPPGSDRFPELRSVLWHLAMRELMAEDCTGRVLLGGKLHPRTTAHGAGYSGPWPGLLEEAWRTLRRDRALYVVGGFGGSAGLIATMLRTGELPPLFARATHRGTPLEALTEQVDVARRALTGEGVSADVVLLLEPGKYADLEDLARMVLERWRRFVDGDAEAWNNGLSLEENRRLLCSTDRTEITYLVFEGLRRLGRTPDGELQLALYLGDIASVPQVEGYAVTVTPGVPPVGASAALLPHTDRTRAAPLAAVRPVELEAVRTGDLAGSHVLVAQLELPPQGQDLAPAVIAHLAEQVAAEASRVGLESVACPVFGTTLGLSVADSTRAMVEGFRRGRGEQPKKLVFCEIDGGRYDALRDALGDGAVELRAGAPAPPRTTGPVLNVDLEEPGITGHGRVRATLLSSAVRAVVPLHDGELPRALWDELQRPIRDFDASIRIGRTLWRELMSAPIRDELAQLRELPLVVLGDKAASTIPWELLVEDRDGASLYPGGVVRRIALRGAFRPPAEQVERSRLRVLLVADPHGDLRGAVPEADAVERALKGRADVIVKRLQRDEATVAAVKAELARGHHDVFHYAGH